MMRSLDYLATSCTVITHLVNEAILITKMHMNKVAMAAIIL